MPSRRRRLTSVRRATPRRTAKVPQTIVVRLARLGSPVQEYLIEKGSAVRKVLEEAGLNGDVTTIKIGGQVVKQDYKLTANNQLVCAIPEVEAQ